MSTTKQKNRDPRSTIHDPRSGFTLLEMLVVFAIIALIATTSAVYLRSYQSSSVLKNSARDIMANLRLASELASSAQTIHLVNFNLQNSTYTITSANNPESIIKNTALDRDISIMGTTLDNHTAQFNNLGAAITSGSITLVNQAGAQKIINLRPSGYVEIR